MGPSEIHVVLKTVIEVADDGVVEVVTRRSAVHNGAKLLLTMFWDVMAVDDEATRASRQASCRPPSWMYSRGSTFPKLPVLQRKRPAQHAE